MTVQFICRGNVFRSIIAETYLRSLRIPGVEARSSGTVARRNKVRNAGDYHMVIAFLKSHNLTRFVKPDYGEDIEQRSLDTSDVIVFMNERAYKEAEGRFAFPEDTIIWDVSDLNELPQTPKTEEEITAAMEKVLAEITGKVDELVRARRLPGTAG